MPAKRNNSVIHKFKKDIRLIFFKILIKFFQFYYQFADVDDCDPDPCENAIGCIDDVNDYTCICETGWTGKNCNIGK